MGMPLEAALDMNESEAEGYLEAWLELNGEKRKKVYRVNRNRKG